MSAWHVLVRICIHRDPSATPNLVVSAAAAAAAAAAYHLLLSCTELCTGLMELARDKLVRSRVASGGWVK
jgi:hypothetical protein